MIEPTMAPYIALAWIVSGVSLGGLTAWSLWRYQRRDR